VLAFLATKVLNLIQHVSLLYNLNKAPFDVLLVIARWVKPVKTERERER
jgi:hypothetical protein